MRVRHTRGGLIRAAILLALLLPPPVIAQNRGPSRKEVQRLGLSILSEIKATLKKHYFDRTFNGINLDQRFKTAEERIKTLETYPHVYRTVAQLVLELDDSHTNFLPPRMEKTVDYGFTWQMIGHKCYVTDVVRGSDAEAKGLKVGDVISGFEDYNPTRETVWLMTYLWYRLDPKGRLKVFVELPDGGERELLIDSKVIETKRVLIIRDRPSVASKPYRCEALNPDVMACKLYTFSTETPLIDEMMKQARKSKKLILDLRGNGGGHVEIELHLIGYFFPHNVKVADEKRRDETKERFAKTHQNKAFSGDLIVLIDSKSMSASEVFARVIQLEKRGKIVGDVSAGRVRTSFLVGLLASQEVPFGLTVTIADVMMSDGQSLERVGVIPDKAIGPTSEALALGNDPVLAYAAAMADVKLTPEEAGKFSFLKSRAQLKQE